MKLNFVQVHALIKVFQLLYLSFQEVALTSSPQNVITCSGVPLKLLFFNQLSNDKAFNFAVVMLAQILKFLWAEKK